MFPTVKTTSGFAKLQVFTFPSGKIVDKCWWVDSGFWMPPVVQLMPSKGGTMEGRVGKWHSWRKGRICIICDKSALAIVGTSASGNVPAAERIEDHGIPLPRPSHLYLPRFVSFVRAYTGSVLLYIQQWQLWKYMVYKITSTVSMQVRTIPEIYHSNIV